MSAPESSTIAVLAEKPSVARDVARVLGATTKGDGYLHGGGYVVTWAVGHLVALAQPHEIQPEWRQWRRDLLPIIPKDWPLVVYEKTKDQFEVVRTILNSQRVSQVVCATDAGREGELIFRYIYEAAQCAKPVSRLWISSLTPDAIRRGFDTLRSGSDYDSLADAARGRSRADWLVGMNLSRAYSLAYGDQLSVGRVQTPTLAMLVERELVIRSFVAEDYLEVVASFRPAGHKSGNTYSGHMVPHAARGGGGQGIAAKGHAAVCRWRRRKPDYRARAGEGGEEPQEGQVLPPDLVKGQPQDVVNIEALKKKTRHPSASPKQRCLPRWRPRARPSMRRNSPMP
jgi:DNA topoisomerase-3